MYGGANDADSLGKDRKARSDDKLHLQRGMLGFTHGVISIQVTHASV